ncbi:nucleotidyl transferase AbiEii/AbiGii toxin family protein [Haloimpatiens sp. FM7330]|uniref:nucleotidyl transferase AbiEii/AbiGii toxin family protein n=1 Tax=Haloimpatiens sp. FM7330 TaxID=3298610 RepID=UPI00363B2E36
MNNKLSSPLIHEYDIFDKHSIANVASKYGFYRNYILEKHLWVYELIGQFQRKCSDNCILKGGACTQLYLPLHVQRCTADIDFLTNLSSSDIIKILTSIKQEFSSYKIKTSFYQYTPAKGKTLPMATFMLELPFHFRPNKKIKNPSLKFDFLFIDINPLHTYKPLNCKTFGMNLNYSPLCICHNTLISDKLLTFAINSVGLETFKLDSFYKNIYDLYYLVTTFDDLNTFKTVSKYILQSISLELSLKNLPSVNVNKVLNDILKTLFYFSIVDLNYEHNRTPKKLEKFQKLFLQSAIKMNLDSNTWSIMSMHLYLWANALKKYIHNVNHCELTKLSLVKKEYSEFLSFNSKTKKKYIKNLKHKISSKNKLFNLRHINDPVRIIYTYYLLFD